MLLAFKRIMSVSVLDKLPYSLPCRVVKMANRLAGNLARCKLSWWNPYCKISRALRSDNVMVIPSCYYTRQSRVTSIVKVTLMLSTTWAILNQTLSIGLLRCMYSFVYWGWIRPEVTEFELSSHGWDTGRVSNTYIKQVWNYLLIDLHVSELCTNRNGF